MEQIVEWRCPYYDRDLPPPPFQWYQVRYYDKRRKFSIPLSLEMLSILSVALISLSVAISVFVAYQVTSVVNGNVTSTTDRLQQSVGDLKSVVNGNVLSQVGQLEQRVGQLQQSISVYSSSISSPGPSINVQFSCLDATTGVVLTDCSLHIRILEQSPVSEYDVAPQSKIPIDIQTRRRLEVTAKRDGYKTTREIFEYIEDGLPKSHSIKLERTPTP